MEKSFLGHDEDYILIRSESDWRALCHLGSVFTKIVELLTLFLGRKIRNI